ncbi:hypothetical protein GOP47_0006731 [Adiantum capillus-veneris]|uniref:OVATE domain-containing protein n=1 Tax=Adiantum capillus-veneris TaxID=13818 RepID=A0A9D4ZNA9_ADICA|nr:hypothetical protein GOP47_0006731 [Adiantum capillus-veneris]
MGRLMRYKLPHAWFYKQSKRGGSIAYTPSSALSRKLLLPTFLSPENHKAIYIAFPAESPRKCQPSTEASVLDAPSESPTHTFAEDLAILSTLHPVNATIDNCSSFPNSASTKRTSNYLEHSMNMGYCSDDDDERFHGFSSSKGKSGSVNNGAAFDVQELERRLKALAGSEGRRDYYIARSPMLSGSLPTPIVETNGSPYYRQGMLRGADVRKSPMAVLAHASPLFDRGIAGDDSSNESNSLRQSTSSSDTGIERRSSSQWERDAFSINSERSETFTTCEDGLDRSSQMKRQRSPSPMQRKPKDWMASAQCSPLLYPVSNAGPLASAHLAKPTTPSLYQDHEYANLVHAEKGRIRSYHGIPRKDSAVLRNINTPGHANSSIHVGNRKDDENVEWDGFNSNAYRSPPSKASPTSSRSSLQRGGQHAVELMNKYYSAGLHPASPSHEQDSYKLLLLAEEENSKRLYCGTDQFSYMGCKERLLSRRTSFEQGNIDVTEATEGEVGRLSNYDKFKLRQVSNTHGTKLSRAWSLSPELGPYRPMQANRSLLSNAPLTRHESYQNTPEHHYIVRGPGQRSHEQIFDPSKSSPHRRGSNVLPYSYAQKGPSWSNKATLKAVREKTRDPGFESFSPSPQPASEVCSRVFDSFAVVKCSYDPKQDFKQSMVEMIFEKDLNSSHDMVELLQCYLTLNPSRYHDTIVKVFTEVWSEVFQDV